MLKISLTTALKSRFRHMIFDFNCAGNVIAIVPPIHQSWEPIIICDDKEEITVFFGKFAHKHYGYYGNGADPTLMEENITAAVVQDLELVFNDEIEFYKLWGVRGFRPKGTQGKLSKFFFGNNGVVWSGVKDQ